MELVNMGGFHTNLVSGSAADRIHKLYWCLEISGCVQPHSCALNSWKDCHCSLGKHGFSSQLHFIYITARCKHKTAVGNTANN